jgi:hypothetical protein
VSDPGEDRSPVTPIRGVFALQIVHRGGTLVGASLDTMTRTTMGGSDPVTLHGS